MEQVDVEALQHHYYDALEPLFFPDMPLDDDVLKFFASLLRVVGMEDRGWDPLLESRAMLSDLTNITQIPLPANKFSDIESTRWRMALLMYCHVIEMDAPYEVITNLLRFRLGHGYSPNPYYDFLNSRQRKSYKSRGIYPSGKIEIIEKLGQDADIEVGALFRDFFNADLRNAISHSDYVMTEDELRVRNGTGAWGAFSIPLEKLNETITKCQAFYTVFFHIERAAREAFGQMAGKALPYDTAYKGLLEVLSDDEGLLCGFRVHWPNNSDSTYRRTKAGVEMTNILPMAKNGGLELMVGLYAQKPGKFSPLVENDMAPQYSKIEGSDAELSWPSNGTIDPK